MKMTFNQYINNPFGMKNSVIADRGRYQNFYSEKLDKILLREGGKVRYTLYHAKGKYYIYFKIPSEVIDKFYYDTVIEFYTDDPALENVSTLKDYYVKFYSNDPAFVFTFAHAFIENGLFIEDLKPKMSKQAIKKVAVEKNPSNMVFYVKSLFFAYLLMNAYGLTLKDKFRSFGEKYNKKDLLNQIEQADDKILARQQAQEDLQKEKKRARKNKTSTSARSIPDKVPLNSSRSNITKNVSSTTRSNIIGRTGSVKRTKKIR